MIQKIRILTALQRGEKLSRRDAMVNLNVGDLAARIRDLKKDGIKIAKEKHIGVQGPYCKYYLVGQMELL